MSPLKRIDLPVLMPHASLSLALAVAAFGIACACPEGQARCTKMEPAGPAVTVSVPGGTSEMDSGISLKKGYRYRVSVTGTIRVGVVGEGPTDPEGWTSQGAAGPGFPAPDLPKFALLAKFGPGGSWRSIGREFSISSGDVPLILGINDTVFRDNTGAFTVALTELASTPSCCPIQNGPPAADPPVATSTPGPSSGPPPEPALPCAGITPDGRLLEIQFDKFCHNAYAGPVTGTGCTREEARQQVRANLQGSGCRINETDAPPKPPDEPASNPGTAPCTEVVFRFCLKCDNGRGETVSDEACTEAEAAATILSGRPSSCRTLPESACAP